MDNRVQLQKCITGELYQRKSKELSIAATRLKEKQEECHRLHVTRAVYLKVDNFEMVEAYEAKICERICLMDEDAEIIIRLKGELEKLPRQWTA